MLRAVQQIFVACIILGIAHQYEQRVVHISEETGWARRETLHRVVQAVKRELVSKDGARQGTTPTSERVGNHAHDLGEENDSIENGDEKQLEAQKSGTEAFFEEASIAVDLAQAIEPEPSQDAPSCDDPVEAGAHLYDQIEDKEELHAMEEPDAIVYEPFGLEETTVEQQILVDGHEAEAFEESIPNEQPYFYPGDEGTNPHTSIDEPLLQDEAAPKMYSVDGDADGVDLSEALEQDDGGVSEAQRIEHTASSDDVQSAFQSPSAVSPAENQAPQEEFDVYDELPAYMRDASADDVLEAAQPDGSPSKESFASQESYPSDDFAEFPGIASHIIENLTNPPISIQKVIQDVVKDSAGNNEFEDEDPWDSDEAFVDDHAQCFAPDCASAASEAKAKRTRLTIALSAMQMLFTQVLVYFSM